MAVTRHRLPWDMGASTRAFSADVWELYDLGTDWTQAHDLAREHPDRLRDLQELFLVEAAKYQVFPLDDRMAERGDPQKAGRPDLLGDRRSMRFTGGMRRFAEDTVPNVKNRSHRLRAEIDVPAGGAHGSIVSQGGPFGGWRLHVVDGHLAYAYNFLGMEEYTVEASTPLDEGLQSVEFAFAYDGGGVGKGGLGRLLVAGREVAAGRIERTIPFFICSDADHTLDVGTDLGDPHGDAHDPPAGPPHAVIRWVEIDVTGDEPAATDDQLRDGQLAQQ